MKVDDFIFVKEEENNFVPSKNFLYAISERNNHCFAFPENMTSLIKDVKEIDKSYKFVTFLDFIREIKKMDNNATFSGITHLTAKLRKDDFQDFCTRNDLLSSITTMNRVHCNHE